MSYFAKVLNGDVLNVIRADSDFFNSFVDTDPGKWIQTSYNVRGGVYYDSSGPAPVQSDYINDDYPARKRKNYAVSGGKYNKTDDAFYFAQPYDSWSLDSDYVWQPPTPRPNDGVDWVWNESTQSWDSA